MDGLASGAVMCPKNQQDIRRRSGAPETRAGNYVKVSGVTPASSTITLTATYQGGGANTSKDGVGVQLFSSGVLPASASLIPKLTAVITN